jgi:hypothetical protein
MQYSLLKRPVTPEDLPQLQQKLDEMSSEVMEQSNIVILMLNPDKEDQYNLQTALQDTLKFLSDCFQKKTPSNDRFNDQNYGDLKNNAFNALTKIGILSWDRIQKLE